MRLTKNADTVSGCVDSLTRLLKCWERGQVLYLVLPHTENPEWYKALAARLSPDDQMEISLNAPASRAYVHKDVSPKITRSTVFDVVTLLVDTLAYSERIYLAGDLLSQILAGERRKVRRGEESNAHEIIYGFLLDCSDKQLELLTMWFGKVARRR